MLKNYFIIAFRYFSRSSVFSIVNILGLVTGISASIFLFLYAWDELRHDRFHTNAPFISRVVLNLKDGEKSVVSPGPLAPALKEKYAEIKETVRVGKWSGLMEYNNIVHEEYELYFADPSLITVFDFPLVSGDPEKVLRTANEILLTEKTAAKYFGSNWRERHDLLGSVIRMNNEQEFSVTGVLKDPPSYSSIQFDMVLPFEYIIQNDKWGYQWQSSNYHTYLLFEKTVNQSEFEKNFQGALKGFTTESPFDLNLQKLTDIYLQPLPGYDWGKHGQKQYVVIFSVVGSIILLIASFNYINLSTARARKRAKEVGIRKVIGATRNQLFFQFMGESILLVIISIIFSRAITDLLLPWFNTLSGKQLVTNDFQFQLHVLLGGVAIITSLLSGIYPALLLSSFKPVSVLKGMVSVNSGKTFRSVLVTAQFTIAMILIAGTLLVHQQLEYVQSKDTGYNKSGLLYIRLKGDLKKNHYPLKDEISKMSFVNSIAASTSDLVNMDNLSNLDWEGKNAGMDLYISQMNTDSGLVPLLDLKIMAGRNFVPSDSSGYILNKEAVISMGLSVDDVIGRNVEFWGTKGSVIGVVENFHYRPMYHPLSPLIIRHAPKELFFNLLVNIDKNNIGRFLREAEDKYRKYAGNAPFDFGFVEQKIQMEYERDERAAKIILYFSILSIFISALGLAGLISYTAEERVKEFSIRKILGADYLTFFVLMSKQFVFLLIIAFILAAPVAWWISEQWLQNFTYRVSVSPILFVVTLVLIALGSMLISGIQGIRAARQNPAEILKNS